MILIIEHVTSYRYARPVTLQAHRLVFTPRDSATLTTIERALRCQPEANLTWSSDVFGNQIAMATFSSASDSLTIINKIRVQHTGLEWPIFEIDPSAHLYPFAYSLDDIVDLGALAQPDWLTPGGDTVSRWARTFVRGPRIDTLSLLQDLNNGVLTEVVYRARDEEGTQSPAETLQLRSGSCRDISALFIEAARHLGFGARAVSGYLVDIDMSKSDAGSTHAWAEVYLPSAGWISFDPTHKRMGSAHLVPVAFGRFNRQIMPVTGSFLGVADASATMDVSVRVRKVDV